MEKQSNETINWEWKYDKLVTVIRIFFLITMMTFPLSIRFIKTNTNNIIEKYAIQDSVSISPGLQKVIIRDWLVFMYYKNYVLIRPYSFKTGKKAPDPATIESILGDKYIYKIYTQRVFAYPKK